MDIRRANETQYQIIADEGEVQIRLYPTLLLAETFVEGDYAQAGKVGFSRLAGYIFGENTRKQEMSMTTPVYREQHGTGIEMTAPVFQQGAGGKWSMAFVMPANYDFSTLPRPLDPLIGIETVPSQKVAVLKYSGSLNAERIGIHSEILTVWLEQRHIKALSTPRSAAYDPPFTLAALRRNEIHIDIA